MPTATVELLNYFRLVLFNYLFANGDAHLKNFALMESDQGDYLLSPAYDLLCTALHINDSDLALRDGLYNGDIDEASYGTHGVYTGQSFLVFAQKAGIDTKLAEKILDVSIRSVPRAIEMIGRSFLSAASRERYIAIIGERERRLKIKG